MCVFPVKGVAQICVGILGSEAFRRSRSASEVRGTNRVVHGPRRRRMALRRRLGLGRGVRAARCADARDLLDTAYLRGHRLGPSQVGVGQGGRAQPWNSWGSSCGADSVRPVRALTSSRSVPYVALTEVADPVLLPDQALVRVRAFRLTWARSSGCARCPRGRSSGGTPRGTAVRVAWSMLAS